MEPHHVQSINRIYKWAMDSIAIKPSNLQVSIHPQDQSNIEPEKWIKMVGPKMNFCDRIWKILPYHTRQ
jgi:hypothetical protein